MEEDQQKIELIKNIPHSSTSKDKDDEDSLPRTRSSFWNQYLSPPRKFNIIENKYFKSEVKIKNFILFSYTFFLFQALEDSDNNDQDIIFLLNETGEQLSIDKLNEFKVNIIFIFIYLL